MKFKAIYVSTNIEIGIFKYKFYFDQFLSLKQGELSVDKYTHQFQELQYLYALDETSHMM